MCDAEHVDWVKSQRDPELWHAAAIAIVNTVGDPHGFLVWLADQPETDRAPAGYFFLSVAVSMKSSAFLDQLVSRVLPLACRTPQPRPIGSANVDHRTLLDLKPERAPGRFGRRGDIYGEQVVAD